MGEKVFLHILGLIVEKFLEKIIQISFKFLNLIVPMILSELIYYISIKFGKDCTYIDFKNKSKLACKIILLIMKYEQSNESLSYFSDGFKRMIESVNSYSYPLLRRRHHLNKLNKKKRQFSIIILKDSISIQGKTLYIDIKGQNWGLFSNIGKRFLIEYDNNHELITLYEEKFYNWMTNNDNNFNVKDIGLRWASAGILPIFNFGNKKFFAFVIRSIYPYGLNLFLGASETEEEYTNIEKLILREFREELFIVRGHSFRLNFDNGRSTPVRKFGMKILTYSTEHEDDKYMRRKFEKHKSNYYTLRMDKYNLHFSDDAENINSKFIDTPYKVIVEGKDTVENILFSINMYELGVDIVRPIELILKDDYNYNDLEVLYGEIWDKYDIILGHPIILIEYNKLIDYVRREEWEDASHLYKSLPSSFVCRNCKYLRGPFAYGSDIYIYYYDALYARDRRIKILLEDSQIKDLKNYQNIKKFYENIINNSSGFTSLKSKYEGLKNLRSLFGDELNTSNTVRELYFHLKSFTLYYSALKNIDSYIKGSRKRRRRILTLNCNYKNKTSHQFCLFLTLCPVTWKSLFLYSKMERS